MRMRLYLPAFCLLLFFAAGCTQETPEKSDTPVDAAILKLYPLNQIQDIPARETVALDAYASASGQGSLRITTREPVRIRLFTMANPALSDTVLVYMARMRSEKLAGSAYLEMLCRFPGQGEFFSRALDTALRDDTDWTLQQARFFLKKGEKPDRITLNVVIDGTGTVWMDTMQLVKKNLHNNAR